MRRQVRNDQIGKSGDDQFIGQDIKRGGRGDLPDGLLDQRTIFFQKFGIPDGQGLVPQPLDLLLR